MFNNFRANQPVAPISPQQQNTQNVADQVQKLQKRKKLADMLGGMMSQQQAPTAAGGLAGALGGFMMGGMDNQNQSDFKDILKNGGFGAAGMGLSKYF